MLKVLPIQTKEEQKSICSMCGVDYNADLLAYAAYDDDKLMGVCQFRLTANGGEIYDLAHAKDTQSFEALFIMGRGTLNFIDLCGIHRAFYDGDESIPGAQLLHAIGFRKNDEGRLEMDLTDFFTTPCKHCKS